MTKPLILPEASVRAGRVAIARTGRVSTVPTAGDIALRAGIVCLALATGYIHATLGGPLFTLNALGYVVAAVAMIVPLGIAVRYRWLIRFGLIAYAAMAIVGWLLIGPRYDVAYLAKGIEVALISLLLLDFVRHDGNPIAVVRRASADAIQALPRGTHHDTPR
jgi:hypothetical protein